MLPPPTWKIILGHTHSEWQKIPVPVRGSLVLICFHTNKPVSGSSSPHAARSEQLSPLDYWQQWCGAISSLSHHRGKRSLIMATQHLSLPSHQPSPRCRRLQGIPSEASLFIRLTWGAWVVVLVWYLAVCVWVLVSAVESHLWEQSEDYFVKLQGRRWTGNSGRTLTGQEGSQLQYQKISTQRKQKGYYFIYMWL